MDYKSLAEELIKDPILNRTWSRETLAIWLRDKYKCVFCTKDLLESYDVAYHGASVDHLLPKIDYRDLENVESNKVLCCRACNCLKRDWDPNIGDPNMGDTPVYVAGSGTLDDEQRSELIGRATRYIESKRKPRAANFEKERDLLRQSKSSSQNA